MGFKVWQLHDKTKFYINSETNFIKVSAQVKTKIFFAALYQNYVYHICWCKLVFTKVINVSVHTNGMSC